jgi:hypothetical protein
MPDFVCAVVEHAFSTACMPLFAAAALLPPLQTDKAASSMLELLVAFLQEKLLTQAEAVEGLKPLTSTLGDVA